MVLYCSCSWMDNVQHLICMYRKYGGRRHCQNGNCMPLPPSPPPDAFGNVVVLTVVVVAIITKFPSNRCCFYRDDDDNSNELNARKHSIHTGTNQIIYIIEMAKKIKNKTDSSSKLLTLAQTNERKNVYMENIYHLYGIYAIQCDTQ